MDEITKRLKETMDKYRESFSSKKFEKKDLEIDILMKAFGLTHEVIAKNKQYWNRELGYCWQLLVTSIFEHCKSKKDFKPPFKDEDGEPADFIFKKFAIDTKYRVGSGDSGTLKKFKQYGEKLTNMGYTPVFLFLREDNLAAAITAAKKGGWEIYTGQESLDFIEDHTGFKISEFLVGYGCG